MKNLEGVTSLTLKRGWGVVKTGHLSFELVPPKLTPRKCAYPKCSKIFYVNLADKKSKRKMFCADTSACRTWWSRNKVKTK